MKSAGQDRGTPCFLQNAAGVEQAPAHRDGFRSHAASVRAGLPDDLKRAAVLLKQTLTST